VAGCCECGDEPSGSCATELVSYILDTYFCNVAGSIYDYDFLICVTTLIHPDDHNYYLQCRDNLKSQVDRSFVQHPN
jgi:hypothetical protein